MEIRNFQIIMTNNPYCEALIMQNGHVHHGPNKLILMEPRKKFNYASQIANLLPKLGGNSVFHPSADKVFAYMNGGHAHLLTDTAELKVLGFAKADPWAVPNEGVSPTQVSQLLTFAAIHAGLARPVVIEIGALVVVPEYQRRNLGKALAIETAITAAQIYPGIPQIAVVTNDNVPSLAVFGKIGWEIVSHPDSVKMFGLDILDGWQPPSTIFINPDTIQ